MNKLLLDETLLSQLSDLNSQLELCDKTGRTLGFFIPAPEHDGLLYEWAHRQFTDHEIEQARQETGGFKVEDILEGLSEG